MQKISNLTEDKYLLAVFWTLKKDFYYHDYIIKSWAIFVKEDYILFSKLENEDNYPIVEFATKWNDYLKVELYEISKNNILKYIDELEEYPKLYSRIILKTLWWENCIVYAYNWKIKNDIKNRYLDFEKDWKKFYNWTWI